MKNLNKALETLIKLSDLKVLDPNEFHLWIKKYYDTKE